MTHSILPGAPALRRYWQKLVDWQPEQHSAWNRYAVALAVTLLAAWLQVTLAPAEAGGRFITVSLAAALSALYGGFGVGMFSTAVGMAAVNFLLVKPYFSFAFDDPIAAFWLNLWHLITQVVVVGAISTMQRRNRDLRETTALLEQSKRRLEDTFEQSATGMIHRHVDGRWIRINQTYCDIVGYTKAEMMKMHFRDFTHPQDLELDLQQLQRTLDGEIAHYSFEKRYIHKQGHIVWANLTLSVVRDEAGKPDYLIAVVQDITARKATEEALRTNEQLLRQAYALAGLSSWRADIANDRFVTLVGSHQMLGLPSAEFSGRELRALMHPDDRPEALRLWKLALKGQISYHIEYRMVFKGMTRWFLVRAEFERDADGRAARALGVIQDITGRKRSEMEVQQLNASLEQRIRVRTQALEAAYEELESYSYAVAHDLRSPLRIINGFAQALQEDNPEMDDGSRSHLERIKAASSKMGELIDGLLTLAQFARGELRREPVDISAIATRLLEEFSATELQRQVQWRVDPGLTAMGDPPLVEALMQNLLHNAWKYTARTPLASVRVYAQQRDGRRYFCVSDNGAGFDMAHAAKLFQPFQRLHMPGEFGGLGIGLATARRIVQRHNGEMQAEAAPGQGATFRFTLG